MRVDSKILIGAHAPIPFTTEQIKNEPMLFSCDYSTASKLGGPLTHVFLAYLPQEWRSAPDLIIDSRVHMLMPGWFPCIPGFHHDDVPRTGQDGQPNYETPEYRSKHVLFLANADVSPTQFALGSAEFNVPPPGEVVYKHWHKEVCSKLATGELTPFVAPDRTLIYFDDRSWHQGVQATKDGWRFFVRASRNTGREPKNELRKQVQVYLPDPMMGW